MASRQALKLIKAAKSGDIRKQLELARLYLDGGEGFAPSLPAAYLLLKRAAEMGQAEAWRLIGNRIPLEAVGDPATAKRWYIRAAAEGCAPAQRKLAQLLLSGPPSNDPNGECEPPLDLLRRAAAAGDAEAQLELGSLILQKRLHSGTLDEALSSLDHAFASGRREAARILANYYWETGKAELARQWYSHCVDLRDAELCYRVGLLNGTLGKSGADMLERAAAAGHEAACKEIGMRYAIGCLRLGNQRKSSRNFKKAARWLERAASLGSSDACFVLSTLYRHPTCPFRDRSKARNWLFEAARGGHVDAQYRAGLLLWRDHQYYRTPTPEEALHCETDVAAAKWLLEAASQGHSEASKLLARIARLVPQPEEPLASAWSNAISAIGQTSAPVAMRLEVARALGLKRHEMLLFDPIRGDRGSCFVVDLKPAYKKANRVIVVIERPEQREVIERAKLLFSVSSLLPGDLAGSYRARFRRLLYLFESAGLNWRLFDRTPIGGDQSNKGSFRTASKRTALPQPEHSIGQAV